MTDETSVDSVPLTPIQSPVVVEPAIRVDESTPQLVTSPTIGKLAAALARVQKALKQPRKQADNPFFKSKYADLHEVWAAASGLLADEGVAVIQSPSFSTSELKGKVIGVITISTTIVHGESGEWMTNVLRGTSENIGPQAIGSAISYFRRYSLQPMLMLTPDDGSDDDGERAEGRTAVPAEEKMSADDVTKHTNAIKAAMTVPTLEAAYKAIPEIHRKSFNKLVMARKQALEAKPLGPPLTNPEEANPPGDSASARPDEG
jgi:hypothetical protein